MIVHSSFTRLEYTHTQSASANFRLNALQIMHKYSSTEFFISQQLSNYLLLMQTSYSYNLLTGLGKKKTMFIYGGGNLTHIVRVPDVTKQTSTTSWCSKIQDRLTFWYQHTKDVLKTGHCNEYCYCCYLH